MSEQLVDVLSKLNENDVPHLDTCTLVIGDGTVKVDFNRGRARVPARVAALIKHPHVEVPGLAAALAAEKENIDAELEEDSEPVDAEEVSVENLSEERESELVGDAEAIEAAKAHLAEEGEEVPDVEVADTDAAPAPEPKPGFEANTEDGQPRCQAAKADGTQCANPAVDGQACGLAKHKAQLQD